jgi:AcrR family transcriptional regulator
MMNKLAGSTRGRRPGRPETRAQILAVARRRFLAQGYQAVTMRAVATEAGVDAALISYFFGSKKGLFGATLALSANPPEILLRALPGDPATLPERVLRALVRAWDDPEHGQPLRVMVTAAIAEPEVARLLKEVIEREMIVLTRYVLQLDPIATMTVDEIVHHLAPGLRSALTVRSPTRRPPPSPPPRWR